ncbi:ROK family protein [Kineococcus radiotolerans]|uniref:ROK family protein n=1 Tax=Kineococcus radiotolerans (strain ATCC BAA-149 / DSM 14245 / SRS30216) TaxID=266940 RepID=A6W6S2_KINRD|nr:ROK family protein [Kineococcus radiotolerans]ABS02511.1 ROK family protein [Kineococcus radiotolerans SRS30216 = ATCC BAA-149]
MTNRATLGRDLLRAAHLTPGLTRADAARALGTGTGTTTEIVVRLLGEHLLAEGPPSATGRRGRPTRPLVAHPEGPLVLAAAISHEDWRLRVVELGGAVVAETGGPHGAGGPDAVLAAVRAAARGALRRFPRRVRGAGLAVPGLVREAHLLDAPLLGWHDVDLRAAWPRSPDLPADLVLAGNDARCAAVAEAVRGRAAGSRLHLHLHLDAGLGGALTTDGQLLDGARGSAGEFGHLPFGDPARRCGCGASGCWGTALDGAALARLLGEQDPPDPVSHGHRVLDRAGAGDPAAGRAVAVVARALGRGTAGLVNALDADLVTLGGLAGRVLDVAPGEVRAALEAGSMAVRRSSPAVLAAAALGADGPLVGAGELVWSRWWDRPAGPRGAG